MREAPRRHQEAAEIVETRVLGGDYHVLVLNSPRIAEAALAGQFVMMGVRPVDEPLVDPLLLRPFSFLSRDAAAGTLEIFYRVVGRGTRLMPQLSAGTRVNVLGPLGKAWPRPPGDVVLVAGGVGMPPILDLATEIAAGGDGPAMTLFYGGRSAEHIHCVERFEAAGADVRIATDDGSLGTHGTCVAALDAFLEGGGGQGATLFGCGPDPMLAALAKVAKRHDRRAFVSLEAPMACGIGVCRGCPVRFEDGGYRMVCVDGPVFPAEEVVFP
jgi:dihydroorotate dehydrogenase electron transfer subunit